MSILQSSALAFLTILGAILLASML